MIGYDDQAEGLLENGEYFVVGLWEEAWDQEDPSKYLRGLLEDKVNLFLLKHCYGQGNI